MVNSVKLCFFLGVIAIRISFAQDCLQPSISNGNFVGDTTEGGTAAVLCHSGYTGGGPATCSGGVWTVLPGCIAKSCGTPTVTNGVLSGDNFYTGTSSIVCNAGYQGGGTATCQSNGQWATLPTCSAKDCGTPTISHGSLSTASSTLYAGSAVVECDSGYTGGGTVVCLNTGNWGTIPACNPVADCGTPTVTNGALTGSTVYSGSATVTCYSGYEGGGAATCQANGNWATLPACTPVDCGTPTIQRGTFSGDTYYTGSANVVCNSGYESSGTTAVCSAGGTWTLPTCTAINCGTLTVANGVFTGDTFYGGSALVTCNTGYTGSGTATCGTSGTWIVAPTCNARDCGDTGIPHSTLIGSTLYNEGAFITCNAGYSGGGTATCLAIGVWQPPLPTCTPKDCGTPTITNGALSADSSTLYDGTATVDCNSGYQAGGTATCQTTATWATLPTCDPVDCGSPNIPNGFLTTGSSTKYAGSAVTGCDSGYELAGTNIAICLADGSWDTLPVCIPKDCGTPAVANGAFSGDTFYAGTASIVCNDGYEGGGTATCLSTGVWNTLPTCATDCGNPSITGYIYSSVTTTTSGSSANVACATGYEGTATPAIVTCLDTGLWESVTGCTIINCGNPCSTGYIYSDITTSSANVACASGYEGTATPATVTCLDTGLWESVTGCTISGCQNAASLARSILATQNSPRIYPLSKVVLLLALQYIALV